MIFISDLSSLSIGVFSVVETPLEAGRNISKGRLVQSGHKQHPSNFCYVM